MYEHNALGYWSGLALCLTKIRSSRARCPATALIICSKIIHCQSAKQTEHLSCAVRKPVFGVSYQRHKTVCIVTDAD